MGGRCVGEWVDGVCVCEMNGWCVCVRWMGE